MTDFRRMLIDVLALEQPWTLKDILLKLTDATDHLLMDHGCDAHGYEEVNGAQREAKKLLLLIEEAHKMLNEDKDE